MSHSAAEHSTAQHLLTVIAAREFRLLMILHSELRRLMSHGPHVGLCPAVLVLFVDQSSSRLLLKFGEDIPTGMEVIEVQTLNFKPNYKFSRLEFFWGTPSHFGCALSRLGQSLARVKI